MRGNAIRWGSIITEDGTYLEVPAPDDPEAWAHEDAKRTLGPDGRYEIRRSKSHYDRQHGIAWVEVP